MESVSRLALSSRLEPNEFDLTVASLLVGLGADAYLPVFRKNNIGQNTLTELDDDDLVKLGVDDPDIRHKILEEVKSLPIYDENRNDRTYNETDALDTIEIGEMLTDSAHYLDLLYLSFVTNKLVLMKTKNIQDCLLHRDMYASDIALKTFEGITLTMDSMQHLVNTNIKVNAAQKEKLRRKKAVVGLVGCTAVAILAAMLVQSLKKL